MVRAAGSYDLRVRLGRTARIALTEQPSFNQMLELRTLCLSPSRPRSCPYLHLFGLLMISLDICTELLLARSRATSSIKSPSVILVTPSVTQLVISYL
jgi:hypothetical protein